MHESEQKVHQNTNKQLMVLFFVYSSLSKRNPKTLRIPKVLESPEVLLRFAL